MKIRVYYEDTDALGIVYHANYFKFIERARSEAFFALGSSPQSDEFHFVARSVEARFIQSAKLGDMLEITTDLRVVKGASIELDQAIYIERSPVCPHELIFTARLSLAFMRNGKVGRIDETAKNLLLQAFDHR